MQPGVAALPLRQLVRKQRPITKYYVKKKDHGSGGRLSLRSFHIAKPVTGTIGSCDNVAKSLIAENWRFAFKHPQHSDILRQHFLDAAVIVLGFLRVGGHSGFRKQVVY